MVWLVAVGGWRAEGRSLGQTDRRTRRTVAGGAGDVPALCSGGRSEVRVTRGRIRAGGQEDREERNGGRIMASNKGAAPLHAWRWKEERSHPQQGGE
jgi:hypothetical protein